MLHHNSSISFRVAICQHLQISFSFGMLENKADNICQIGSVWFSMLSYCTQGEHAYPVAFYPSRLLSMHTHPLPLNQAGEQNHRPSCGKDEASQRALFPETPTVPLRKTRRRRRSKICQGFTLFRPTSVFAKRAVFLGSLPGGNLCLQLRTSLYNAGLWLVREGRGRAVDLRRRDGDTF